jgi:hypothetical protein
MFHQGEITKVKEINSTHTGKIKINQLKYIRAKKQAHADLKK